MRLSRVLRWLPGYAHWEDRRYRREMLARREALKGFDWSTAERPLEERPQVNGFRSLI